MTEKGGSYGEQRRRTRARLIVLADRDDRGRPLCERCGHRVATDVHEMVNRFITVGNADARRISYLPSLCVLLCRECHEQAPRRDVEAELWEKLYLRNGLGSRTIGRETTLALLHELNSRGMITIYLPD